MRKTCAYPDAHTEGFREVFEDASIGVTSWPLWARVLLRWLGMSLPEHLAEAASRLELAAARIEQARAAPPSLETVREWLDALTAYTEALSDLHRFTNESVHEKLHEVAARVGLESLLQGSDRQRAS